MRYAIVLTILALLGGCASIESPLDDGYQFADALGTVDTLQARYCAAADPNQRAIILALLHRANVPIPERGACTDLLKLIDPGELSGIDVEAAQRDQERFQDDAR